MELEAKLDEDFLFYLNFTDTFLRKITNKDVAQKCEVWLAKLLAEPSEGIDKKRCRNMYLAHLLINMQNGVLEKPFSEPPYDADIRNATQIFGPIPDTIEPPAWLNDTDYDPNKSEQAEKKDGRTYVATRTLPDGQGAIAYIGVSLTDQEPMWLGGGESSFDRGMQRKFDDMCPALNEIEKILARRKDPKEREKVLAFYDVLMQNIADELDGKETAENETIEGLLIQLVHDLMDKNQYEAYEELPENERRNELLLLLFDRVKIRRDKVQRREEILDNLEEKLMPKSFFDVSDVLPEDKYKMPAAMWEQAIDKIPAKNHMESLQKAYPLVVIMKFLECLSNYKENIALRMQRRHENVVTQMKKELRKEGEKKKKMMEEAETACDNAQTCLEAVREHYNKKLELEKREKEKHKGETSEHAKLYEQMKTAVLDTQKLVEEEALRGKFLATQINALTEQNEQFIQVNEEIIKKTEEGNNKIMKNIKKLNAAIKQYENMIAELKATTGGNQASPMFAF
ncbi:unnamed protein product [Callosobruchus maculatus]|uniref:DUF4485 domain-containing protein n=1 Tax=Callosobruchus maculatus TaxID=64391 RepID=A0A653CL39_CALMS|nr:unnamed protein product [Callosobruchus maculatus]